MTGKHELTPAPASRGADRAAGPAVPGRPRAVMARAWRRLTGAASAAAVAFALVSCACCLVAVAGPRTGVQVRTNAFRQLAASVPEADTTVVGTLDAGTVGSALNQQVGASQLELARDQLREHLAKTVPLARARADWTGMTTPFSVFPDKSRAVGSDTTQLELAYRDNLSSNVRVVAGSLPAGYLAGPTDTLQVAVTAATAQRFNLRVGSRVTFDGSGIVLRVTGIVAPVAVRSQFWTLDPVVAAPVVIEPQEGQPYWQGGAFVSAGEAAILPTRFVPADVQLTFVVPLVLDNLTAAEATRLATTLPAALATAGQLVLSSFASVASVTLTSGAVALLDQFAAQDTAISGLLDLMSVSLAVVGAAIVLLVAWLMAERRRDEFAMLRARGAARRQLAGAALAGAAVAALPGAAIGAALAVLVTPRADAPLGWWLAALTILAALVGPVLITVRVHRGYAAMARPDRPTARLASARRIVAEAALALASIGGLVALRYQHAGARGGDVYASAAPILAAIPVALVILRLYPLLVRPLLGVAARRSGVTTFLGLARAARVAATAVLPAFAMVLALSLVSFAGMVRGAVVRGEIAEAWQAVGADAVISVPGSIGGAERHSIAALPGVLRTVPVVLAAAQAGPGTGLTVVFADPAQYAALRAGTPLGSVPASFARWRGAAGGGSAVVPVLASGTLAVQFGHQATTITLQDGQRLHIDVVGTAPASTQVQDIAGPNVRGYVIVPRSAANAFAPATNTLLVGGPSLNGGALTTAVAKWHVPGTLVVVRAQLLAALEHAPLQHGAYAELAAGGDAAAIGCMLVLLLTLMLAAPSRQLTLARTAAMGMTSAQGRWLALIESVPQIVAVVVGGLVSALVLVPLIGPTLGLSVFTGSSASVPVRIEPVWLAGTAIGLLVLALLTLAGQTAVASRQTPRSLRIGG